MSLPVRQPPSTSKLSTPRHKKRTPSTPSTKKTSSKTAAMSQHEQGSSPLSSPLSSPPETVKSLQSSSPTQLSPEKHVEDSSPSRESKATAETIPAIEIVAELHPSSPVVSTALRPVTKRDREEGDEDGSLPPKKTATSSKAKAKAKITPKSSPAQAPRPKKPVIKKTPPPPPPPNTRPSRNRKAPERFEDLKQPTPIKSATVPTKKRPSKVFDPAYITTNSSSRLCKADIYHMLLEPTAWTSLTPPQQATLLSMLPQVPANTALLAQINDGKTPPRPQAFTLSNDCFRTDVAKFKEDLGNGHLAKTWQVQAEQAVKERAEGAFDGWKAEEAELWWGQKGGGA
ncbi:Asx homology domain-containing protein [Phaeosphaeriaceae sp. PMI808]|nr:Asx homology domain-containing protein [Phaeosphaeriaceae sp. PMI808]